MLNLQIQCPWPWLLAQSALLPTMFMKKIVTRDGNQMIAPWERDPLRGSSDHLHNSTCIIQVLAPCSVLYLHEYHKGTCVHIHEACLVDVCLSHNINSNIIHNKIFEFVGQKIYLMQ